MDQNHLVALTSYDRFGRVRVTKTPIDNSGAKGLHGIQINNSNGANPFTGVLVDRNTIYGAELSDPHNHVSGGLILARTASISRPGASLA